ncbi:MAG: GNAT family N-acetyltransferase [Candidatus Marinimicrobia bacterium]|jgi:ribosomal-protein-alanine N-acetyltransferase|nr:GNAT family N-acetyltransferase [Candidatus Neomarinimicrobiota bacterium]MBT3633132.1 GNAT family N-acetyltransferase [Candidatus Neomarinimicrobiota bacterium]MBT3682267.1 GNAT family N-acetyltransferase [Candidatus Neomarinimicrobiota bacterium]MBT3758732.1 GNAT family N-acetyltransferase [Candidatus Neomarinimicrobiota bacterium]MBT3895394.1 GNAT family N-acetyltransferase [Candidatus Neomarinimicrobiota bacterium]
MFSQDILKSIIQLKPVIHTPDIYIRMVEKTDNEAIFEYASDPIVSKYHSWDPHQSLQDTHGFLSRYIEFLNKFQKLEFGIILKENDTLIGMCGFHDFSFTHSRCEIRYVLSAKYREKDLLTESVEALIEFGFTRMELNRIEARTRIEDIASQRVLKNVGMNEEGLLREQMFIKGQFTDFKLYSKLKREHHRPKYN